MLYQNSKFVKRDQQQPVKLVYTVLEEVIDYTVTLCVLPIIE